MNLSPVERGTAVCVYLLLLAALLFVVLIWRGVQRRAALETVEISTGIFVAGLLLSYRIADHLTLGGSDSLWIYVPPVVPVAIFVFWLLRRRTKTK